MRFLKIGSEELNLLKSIKDTRKRMTLSKTRQNLLLRLFKIASFLSYGDIAMETTSMIKMSMA